MKNKNLIGFFVLPLFLLVIVGCVFGQDFNYDDEELAEKEFWLTNSKDIIENWDETINDAWNNQLSSGERKEIYNSLTDDDQRTKLFNKWDGDKRNQYMGEITGKEFGGLADAQNSKIENGLLTFDKGSGARHKIPVDNIPEEVKSYKFSRNYNGPENEQGVFTKLKDGNTFYSDNGAYVQKEGGKLVAKDYTYTDSKGVTKSVESVELNFGKNGAIRIGSENERYKNGIGMWGKDVSVKIGNRVFSPNINGPVPAGDEFSRPYGHVDIMEEGVFRVTGNYQTYNNDGERIINGVMYGTKDGVVAFKKLTNADLARIKQDLPDAKVISFYDLDGIKQVSGNAFGHTAFDISESTKVDLHAGKGEGYEVVDFNREDGKTFLRAVKSEEGVIKGAYEKLEEGYHVRRMDEAEYTTDEGTKRVSNGDSEEVANSPSETKTEVRDKNSGASAGVKDTGTRESKDSDPYEMIKRFEQQQKAALTNYLRGRGLEPKTNQEVLQQLRTLNKFDQENLEKLGYQPIQKIPRGSSYPIHETYWTYPGATSYGIGNDGKVYSLSRSYASPIE